MVFFLDKYKFLDQLLDLCFFWSTILGNFVNAVSIQLS